MNVIVVMSDSFRRDHIAAVGKEWVKTPALDRFLGHAWDFPNFRMGSYATIPQRTDMFTGRFSFAERPWQALEPEDVVLPELLSEAGVATYCSADTPHLFRSAQLTFMRGFDGFHWSRGSEGDIWWTDYYNEAAYQPPTGRGRVRISERRYRNIWSQGQRRVRELDWTTPNTFNTAIEWLTRNYRRDGFFLYIDTFDPHEPWDPPQWAGDLYDPDYDGIPYAWAEYGSVDQYGGRELEHLRALYAGECTMVDRWFGRLMNTVDLLGLAENTMVVFLSDHGHYLGYPSDGGQVGKWTGYRESDGKMASADADVFVPLLDPIANPVLMVRMPGQQEAGSVEELVQPADLMPTILEFMDQEVPDTVQAQSFGPLMEGREVEWRERAITACFQNFAEISDRRWLYGAWSHQHPSRLYDREADPDMAEDCIREHPDVARKLHEALMGEMRRLQAPEDWVQSLDEKAGLAGL